MIGDKGENGRKNLKYYRPYPFIKIICLFTKDNQKVDCREETSIAHFLFVVLEVGMT